MLYFYFRIAQKLPAALSGDIAQFTAWSRRYDNATRKNNLAEFVKIGRDIFVWLDEHQ